MLHSAILVKHLMEAMDADLLWAPGVTICDGIAYEYAENHKLITLEHDFEKDILSCTDDISRRYLGNKKRVEAMERIALTIFDGMKRYHGLGKRERLLLQIAVKLLECGKYVSFVGVGECSYQIIMATEIIGLSETEREIVANIVRYNSVEIEYYNVLGRRTTLDEKSYLIIAKLTAILRVADGLDRSNKQKFKEVKTAVREGKLFLSVDTTEDITLERGLFGEKAKFFEEVYSIVPVIRQKKRF
jgi:exopolyphosphatase/guanosine-5'-triphosphate,3'-diphosphate pyrophosphatase